MRWLGAAVAAPVLSLGCGHTKQAGECSTCGGGWHPPAVSAVAAPAPQPVDHELASPPPRPYPSPYPMVMTPRSERAPVMMTRTAPAPVSQPEVVVPTITTAVASDPLASGSGYHHSPDYTALVGELNFNTRSGMWRLRYAPVDEEDRYGGCVTLDSGSRMMQGFKNGQRVRVDGMLSDPDSREISPDYRVRDIFPLAD
jgi:hypothetical protein